MIFSKLCSFYTLSLSNLANHSAIIFSVVIMKCVIFGNPAHTTQIAFFPVTNSNFMMKSTIKCINGFFRTLFAISFSASNSILFLIFLFSSISYTLLYTSWHLLSFLATDNSLSLTLLSSTFLHVQLPAHCDATQCDTSV